MINQTLLLAEYQQLQTTLHQPRTTCQVRITKTKCNLCSVEWEINNQQLEVPKMLDFISRHLNLLRNMVTLRIKIDNSDLIWKTLVVIKTRLQETKPVVFLVYLMDMVESKCLNIAQRPFQLSLERRYKRNLMISMQFMKASSRKLTVN